MAQWEKICPVEDLPEGTQKCFPVGAMDILLVHSKGKHYYASSNECPHLGEPLDTGEVHGHVIRCNAHGYKMDLANGRCLTEGDLEMPVFPVEVRDDWIWVKL